MSAHEHLAHGGGEASGRRSDARLPPRRGRDLSRRVSAHFVNEIYLFVCLLWNEPG